MLEFEIVEKGAVKLIGRTRTFKMENCYSEIPQFWDEHFKSEYSQHICGMFALSYDFEMDKTEYMIADQYNEELEKVEGLIVKELTAGTWAVFPCRGPLPHALQDVNTKIWNEWMPNQNEYEMAGNYSVEAYTEDMEYNEIWVPVIKK